MQVLRPGDLIDDRYEVVSVLGAGGFGTVYKARQTQFDRLVAVKLLHQTMADSEERARFDREAKAMNALHHRNIVSLYGIGFFHGAPYMVTELAAGPNLYDVLAREEKLDRVRAERLFQQVLASLSCAHQAGVIHRDLKPSNIILTRDADGAEVVKVIDFGLAKMLPGYGVPSQKLTETGFALGTAHYMSPEQCMGAAVDGRTDIYSVGCMMYQCLTGRVPFDALEIVELMYQHLNAPPPRLSAFLPEDQTTAALQNFCDNCLAKDADLRYASADEAMRDLNNIEMGQSKKVKAFAPTSSSRKQRTLNPLEKKSKWPLVATVAAAAFLCGAAFVAYWMSPKASDPPPPAVAQRAHGEDLSTTVVKTLEEANIGESELADKLHDQLLKELTQDERVHYLTPYHRSRLAYLLSIWYIRRDLPEAERWARLAWDQRGMATNYPERARNHLIRILIDEGKFEEADNLTREMVKGEDSGSLGMIRNVSCQYMNANRQDRSMLILESILGLPSLTPRLRQFTYNGLGDTAISRGRVRDARRFYEAGSAVQGDEIFPNPNWIGLARVSFLEHQPDKAHKYLQNVSPEDFGTHGFPDYDGYVVQLADAAWRHDKAGVESNAAKVRSYSGKWIQHYVDLIAAVDDQIAQEALRKNGFADVDNSLAPLFDAQINKATRHSREPKLQQRDAASDT